MLLKIHQHFNQAILKTISQCVTLLNSFIKTTLLTPHVLDLMNKTKHDIILNIRKMAKTFTIDSQSTDQEKKNEGSSSKNYQSWPLQKKLNQSQLAQARDPGLP